MKVNFNQQNFQGKNLITKEFTGALKDSSTAHVRVTFDDKFNFTKLDCLALKNGKIRGGQQTACGNGINKKEVAHFFETLQKDAKEGVDFLKELAKSLIS